MAVLIAVVALFTTFNVHIVSAIIPARLPVPGLPVRQTTLQATRLVHDLLPDDTEHGGRHAATRASLERFSACLEKWGGCKGERTERVIIFFGYYLNGPFYGCVSGECIWAESMSYALGELGYTVLYADNRQELLSFYRATSHFVSLVIMQKEMLDDCLDVPNAGCFRSAENPDAVPLWKTVMFWFWPGGKMSTIYQPAEERLEFRHPLGGQWVISPEPYKQMPGIEWSTTRYIGYSIEHHCTKDQPIPFEQRPNRVYVFGKNQEFFVHPWAFAYPDGWFAEAKKHYTSLNPDFEFIAGVKDSNDTEALPGIRNLGFMNQATFRQKLASSRAVMGLGMPELSPTAYVAMCMGVPFLNAVVEWDHDDPTNTTKWTRTQHPTLQLIGEPYAYHFFKRDGKSALRALDKAISTPISRYIPPNMKMEALKQRMSQLVDNDWYTEAKARVHEKALWDFSF